MVNRTDIVLREVSQWKVPGKIKEKMRCKGLSSKIEGRGQGCEHRPVGVPSTTGASVL